MGTFLKKDLIILLRNRAELTTLLLMPLILIIILGFALGGLFVGNTAAIQMKVAIVQEDDEQQGVKDFVEELRHLNMPEEIVNELQVAANEVSPFSVMKTMFQDENFSSVVETVEMTSSIAEEALKAGEITAVLTLPEHFTYFALKKALLGIGDGSTLHLAIDENRSLRASVFQEMIDSFIHTFNFEAAINQSLRSEEAGVTAITAKNPNDLGGIETVAKREPASSFQYYTIGMAVMFVLYVSGTVASQAYVEKQQHVFQRILLANQHPIVFLSGKFISAMVIAILQLFILFSITSLIFEPLGEATANFWLGIALISVFLAFCVGAIGALMTAIIVRYDSQGAVSIFIGGIVSIFAFLGGSFFPTAQLHPIISQLGNWTPNGAALSAYLQWMQGLPMEFLFAPLSRIALLAIVILLISVLIFPKRRSV